MAHLSQLILSNFRSFAELELSLRPGISVFFGDNAQGKTTLLEAIYLLAIARSFRAENEREVVNFHAAQAGAQALVGGTFQKAEQQLPIYIGYQPQAAGGTTRNVDGDDMGARLERGNLGLSVRKQIRVSRMARSATDLVGMVGQVLFSADDLELVYGSPSGRRRYLDILISQSDPLYIKTLQRYQRVVQQRNQLLKALREGRAESAELEFWDAELIKEGVWVTCRRSQAVELLSNLGAEHYLELGGPQQYFQIRYLPTVTLKEDLTATEKQMAQDLEAARRRELATAATTIGPHRDDFALLVNYLDMGTFASRGEARTVALTLRLAEASYLAQVRNEEPIVLLDDVLSEMDHSRQKRVLDKICNYEQTLITTTDPELIRQLLGREAAYYQVNNGRVTAVE